MNVTLSARLSRGKLHERAERTQFPPRILFQGPEHERAAADQQPGGAGTRGKLPVSQACLDCVKRRKSIASSVAFNQVRHGVNNGDYRGGVGRVTTAPRSEFRPLHRGAHRGGFRTFLCGGAPRTVLGDARPAPGQPASGRGAEGHGPPRVRRDLGLRGGGNRLGFSSPCSRGLVHAHRRHAEQTDGGPGGFPSRRSVPQDRVWHRVWVEGTAAPPTPSPSQESAHHLGSLRGQLGDPK